MRLLMVFIVLILVATVVALALRPGPAPLAIRAPVVIANLPPLPPLVASATGVVLAWSAHARAGLEPCGCVAGMHGGLVRRAALLTRVPTTRLLAVELGGWSGGSADYQVVKTQHYLAALHDAGIAAIALGAAELRLGAPTLARLVGSSSVPVLAANVVGVPVQPVLRLERSGQTFAVTAVVPAEASGDGLTVGDPAEALLRLLPTLHGVPLIVLADLDEAALSALARSVPGLAAVVGGNVQQPSVKPFSIGACQVVYVANEGKTIGWWPLGSSNVAFELVRDAIPDHPLIRARIRAYQEALGTMNLSIDERIHGLTSLSTGGDADLRFVGDAACTACHAGAAAVHGPSRHAHALASLERKGYARDPECLRCHVTGLGLPDGWRRTAPVAELAHVSCESCHGRGSRHVSERAAGRPGSGSLVPVTPATCLTCHDKENSPAFSYDTYWTRIRHGQK